MNSGEVLSILRISRPTLKKYMDEGKIRVILQDNGRYDYNGDDVHKIANKGIDRKNYIYARVSTKKQKPDLEN